VNELIESFLAAVRKDFLFLRILYSAFEDKLKSSAEAQLSGGDKLPAEAQLDRTGASLTLLGLSCRESSSVS
jgi:hypothetical protein